MHHSHNEALYIRESVHAIRQRGLDPFFQSIRQRVEELELPLERKGIVDGQLNLMLERVRIDDDIELSIARLSGMLRYLLEQGEYRADPVQYDHLRDQKLLKPGDLLVDLGTGPGNIVKMWDIEGNPAVGIDASPSFVARNKLLKLGLIDDDEQYLRSLIGDIQENRTVLSSLTLDRVGKPKQLLRNIVGLAGEKGNFGVASLFPLIPEDDENVDHKIVYTPPHHRLHLDGTEEGDAREVHEYLQDMSKRIVHREKIPYTVHTSSGTQEYSNYHILTSKPL